jgi:hypothetical protein
MKVNALECNSIKEDIPYTIYQLVLKSTVFCAWKKAGE